jgi:hypothetical protein
VSPVEKRVGADGKKRQGRPSKPKVVPSEPDEHRVTGSAEVEVEQRRAQMAALAGEAAGVATTAPEPETATAEPAPETKIWLDPEKSLAALENFKYGCKTWLPALTDEHWERARIFFDEYAMQRNRARLAPDAA